MININETNKVKLLKACENKIKSLDYERRKFKKEHDRCRSKKPTKQ